MTTRWFFLIVLTTISLGCGSADGLGSESQNVKVGTQSALAWAQYQANLAYAMAYQPVCGQGNAPVQTEVAADRPRVLVTGFGRFQSNWRNASGQIVATLIDELSYPLTDPPPSGEIDPPEAQTAVARSTIALPDSGPVELCVMVLPVFWDLAALLALKEIEAFDPDLVIMNGIAGSRQPLWLELGAVNRARGLQDGSNILAAVEGSPLISTASDDDTARGNLLSWQPVREAIELALASEGPTLASNEMRFDEIAQGTRLAGFPRSSNTYLCNNTTYTVGYLMDHVGETVRLLEASDPRDDFVDGIDMALSSDHAETSRVFIHWPSELDDAHLRSGAALLLAARDAQLATAVSPTRGTNELAELPGDG